MDRLTQERYLEELKLLLVEMMEYSDPAAYFRAIEIYDKLKMFLQTGSDN